MARDTRKVIKSSGRVPHWSLALTMSPSPNSVRTLDWGELGHPIALPICTLISLSSQLLPIPRHRKLDGIRPHQRLYAASSRPNSLRAHRSALQTAAYVATQSIPEAFPTGSPSNGDSSGTNIAPIIGGVVGGVVALALLTFLIFLWRRDKAARARGEGAPVQKVKRAEGKMAIDDAPPGGGFDGNHYYGSYGAATAPQHRGGWSDGHYSGHTGDGSWTSQHGLLPSGAAYGAAGPPTSPSSPSHASHMAPQSRFYDPVPYRGVTPDSYPYVVQGTADDKRMYAVPELD